MTKTMPADAMLEYLKHMEYAFKYDDVIKYTKRAVAKERKEARDKKKLQALPTKEQLEEKEINLITDYSKYYSMFDYMYPTDDKLNIVQYPGDFRQLVTVKGYRGAYAHVVDHICCAC